MICEQLWYLVNILFLILDLSLTEMANWVENVVNSYVCLQKSALRSCPPTFCIHH